MEEITHENPGSMVPLTEDRDYASEKKEQATKLQIGDELHKFFLQLFEIEKQDQKEWLDIKKNWIKARKYYDGKQFGYVSDGCQWYDYNQRPGQVSYKDNIFFAHVRTALTELVKSSTELSFSHIAKESRKGQLIARVAEARYRTHKLKTFNAAKTQQEKLSQLLNGVAARYTYFNRNRKEKTPVFGEKETQPESVTVCAECSAPVKDQYCGYCGSSETMEMSASGQAKVITGYEDSYCGESDWCSVDPLGLNFYLHAATVKETPWIVWKQAVLLDVLQSQFPEIPIKEGVESRELNFQFATDTTPHAGNGFSLEGNASGKKVAEIALGWFDPPMYAHRVIAKETQLANGMILKAGKKLGEYFPKGIYLYKHGQYILDVWPESKNDKWTIAPYGARPGTMVGAGVLPALDDQDTKNDLRNLHMASIFQDAYPKKFLNGTLIDPDQIPDDPAEWAVLTNVPDGKDIVGGAIGVLPGMSLSPDAYQIEERIDASMQMKLGTFSGSSLGSPDLQAVKNTASAFLAWRNMTIGRYGPDLALAADSLDREQAYQLLENDQKYLTPDQWKMVADTYDEESVKVFLNCNLREELLIEVVGESYMPTDSDTKRAKTEGYMAMMLPAMQAGINPHDEMGSYIAQNYDVPKSIVGYDASETAVYAMIDAFKMQVQGVVGALSDIPTFSLDDPVALQMAQLVYSEAGVNLDPQLDDCPAMVNIFKDFWQTDECRTSPNLMKATIAFTVRQLNDAVVRKTQEDQMLAMAAQQPMMEAQAMAAQAQAQAEAEANSANDEEARSHEQEMADRESQARQEDMQARAVEASMQSEQADVDHQRNMESMQMQDEMAERQHARDMAAKDKDIELAKAKKSDTKKPSK